MSITMSYGLSFSSGFADAECQTPKIYAAAQYGHTVSIGHKPDSYVCLHHPFFLAPVFETRCNSFNIYAERAWINSKGPPLVASYARFGLDAWPWNPYISSEKERALINKGHSDLTLSLVICLNFRIVSTLVDDHERIPVVKDFRVVVKCWKTIKH